MATVRTFTVVVTLDDAGRTIATETRESSRPLQVHEFEPKSRLSPHACLHCDRVQDFPVHRTC